MRKDLAQRGRRGGRTALAVRGREAHTRVDRGVNPMAPSLAELAQIEARTRAERAPTRTLGEALRVFLTSPSPALITVLITLTVTLRVGAGAFVWWEWVLPLCVCVFWPLQEWGAHRWILHVRPRRVAGIWFDPYFARRHRQHHANPSLYRDIFLPSRVVLGAWVGFGGAFLTAGVPLGPALTLLGSISAASLLYEWTHFFAHTDVVPRSRYVARLVTNHRLHHYRNEQHWFAFTVPHLDDWFGTGGAPRAVAASPTARSLGVDDTAEAAADDRRQHD